MSTYQTCALCGREGPQVTVQLLRFRERVNGREYEVWPVCTRRDECRARVEQLGEEWPLEEREALR